MTLVVLARFLIAAAGESTNRLRRLQINHDLGLASRGPLAHGLIPPAILGLHTLNLRQAGEGLRNVGTQNAHTLNIGPDSCFCQVSGVNTGCPGAAGGPGSRGLAQGALLWGLRPAAKRRRRPGG